MTSAKHIDRNIVSNVHEQCQSYFTRPNVKDDILPLTLP